MITKTSDNFLFSALGNLGRTAGAASKILWHGGIRPTMAIGNTAMKGVQGLGDLMFGNKASALLLGIPVTATGVHMYRNNLFSSGINYVDPKNFRYSLEPGTFFNKYHRNY